MMLSGQLEDWSVADLLHMLGVTGKRASLAVAGDGRSGVVHFDGGMIVDAELTGAPLPGDPRSRIVETIYVLQTMTRGEFAVASAGVVGDGVRVDVAEVLAVAAERLSLEKTLRTGGLLDGALGLVAPVTEAATLSPEDWEVLADVVSTFTFATLEERIGRSRAVAFLASLERIGLVEARTPVVPLIAAEEHAAEDEAEEDSAAAGGPGGGSWTVPDWEETTADLEVVVADGPSDEPGAGRRREMRAVISPADTTLVPGVLSDIRQRFRGVDGSGAAG